MAVDRDHWMEDVENVIRSRHYSWLPEGLGGEPVDVAMTYLLTDIRHICRRTGASFETVLEQSRKQFLAEEKMAKDEDRD
jgi:hypothetical protein